MMCNETVCVDAMHYHTARFMRADVKINGTLEKVWTHAFMADAFLSMQLCGFVVFRFSLVQDKLVPVVIPMDHFSHYYDDNSFVGMHRIPRVDCKKKYNGRACRAYVYTFNRMQNARNTHICTVLNTYRRILHIRTYNLILQNQMLKTTLCFSEQKRQEQVARPPEAHQTLIDDTFTSYCQKLHMQSIHIDEISSETEKEKKIERKIETSRQETAMQNTYEDCIPLPANTAVTNPTSQRTLLLVDEDKYRIQFEETVARVFVIPEHTPSSGHSSAKNTNTSNSTNAVHEHRGSNYSSKLRHIQNRENIRKSMELMLCVVSTVLNDPKTVEFIKKYDKETDQHALVPPKKRKCVAKPKHSDVIPVQLLEYAKFDECLVSIPDVDDFDFMLGLYEKSLLTFDDFAPYFKSVIGMNLNKPEEPASEGAAPRLKR